MTISHFVEFRLTPDGQPVGGRGARRRYRAEKRLDAQDRQAAFDAEVAQVMREQNCGPVDARYVVNARRRHEHRLAQR